MKIYLIAGEPSGDVIGAQLMKAMRAAAPGVSFFGIGGPLMERQGLHSLFPMTDLSVMGLAEVMPKLRLILRRIRETADHITAIGADAVITIDAPDFSFRVAKRLRGMGAAGGKRPLLVHYVAPTVWAWRPWRAGKVARLYDGLLCLFPFEPPYFQKYGLATAYVGHPVMEQGYEGAEGAAIREETGIPADAPVLGLLFGSRMGEVERHGAILCDAARILQKDKPALHILVPTLPQVEPAVRAHLTGLKNIHVTTDRARNGEIFAAMNGAAAVSGTVALELTVTNVPHVIAYRTAQVTWEMIRHLIRVRFAHLGNILLSKEVVPEFIQKFCTAGRIAAALSPLLAEGNAAEGQRAEFATIRKLLHGKTRDAPSVQAARFILELMKNRDSGFKPYQRLPTGT